MMGTKSLLAALGDVHTVTTYVKVNYYTEVLVTLKGDDAAGFVAELRKKLTDKGSPSSRPTSRFNTAVEFGILHVS